MNKKITSLFLSFILICLTASSVFAVGTVVTGPRDVVAGTSVTYRITIYSPKPAGSFSASINASGIRINSVSGGPSNWNNSTSKTTINSYFVGNNPQSSATYVLRGTVTSKSGVGSISISGVKCGIVNGNIVNEVDTPGGSIRFTIKPKGQSTTAPKPEYHDVYATTVANKPSDNNLKSLSVEGYELNPKFSASNTSYQLPKLPETVENIKIKATANDPKAKVEIFGEKLALGKNVAMVNVTAQNGAVKTYNISVVRGEETTTSNTVSSGSELKLRNLEVNPGILSPKFSPEKKEYVVYLPFEESKVTIFAEPKDSLHKVEGPVKDKDIKVGNNIFEIKVTDPNTSKSEKYVVNVVRMPLFSGASSLVTPDGKIGDKKFVIYLLIVGLLSLLTGVLITLLIENFKKNKSKNKTEKTKSKNTEMLKTEKENLDFEDKYIIKQNENIKETKEKKKETDLSNDDFFNKYLD